MEKILNVSSSELVTKLAGELKSKSIIKKPDWADIVKTGTNKARPPKDPDWYYMRAASILLKIQSKGPVGVSKLRTEYGSKKRRGHQPPEFRKASGSIIRRIMQQLQKAELIKQGETGVHKGRIMLPKGISLISSVSGFNVKSYKSKKAAEERKLEIKTEKPKAEVKAEDAKAEHKKETRALPEAKKSKDHVVKEKAESAGHKKE